MSGNNPFYALAGAVAGALIAGEYASAASCGLYVGICLLWKAWRKHLKKTDKLFLLAVAQLLALPFFYMDSLNECMLGLANLSVGLVLAAVLQHGLLVVRQLQLRRLLTGEELFGLCVLMGLAVLSLSRLAPFGISLGLVLAVTVLEVAALTKGAVSVAAAAALGAAFVLGQKGELLMIANLSLCTLAAASARGLGRYGTAAGFCVCAVLIRLYVGEGYSAGIVEAAAGTLVFLLVPKRMTAALRSQVDSEAHRIAREAGASARIRTLTGERLSEISEVFKEVSSLFPEKNSPRSEQSAAVASLTEGVGNVMKKLSERINSDCRYDEESEARVLIALDREGIRAKSLGVICEDNRMLAKLNLFDPEDTDAACFAAARALGRDLRVRKSGRSYTVLEETYNFEACCGASACPKDGYSASGDTIGVREPDGGRILFMLSDGMGCGEQAHAISCAAVALLGDLVCIGFEIKTALDFVNQMLIEKGKDDLYATMDALLFDMNSGSATFIKYGAPASYILRDGKVHTVYAEALPAGIIKSAEPAIQCVSLKHGDTVVLMTDGVSDSLGSSLVASVTEKAAYPNTEKKAAESLLDIARGSGASDDMSVIVVRIK
jgi:serine phosphatase RsbU (regulator of sigma subunit)